jgi:hypothetical protein
MPSPAPKIAAPRRTRAECLAQLNAWTRQSCPLHTFVLRFDDGGHDEARLLAESESAFIDTPGLHATRWSTASHWTLRLRAPVTTDASTLVMDLWGTRTITYGSHAPTIFPLARG